MGERRLGLTGRHCIVNRSADSEISLRAQKKKIDTKSSSEDGHASMAKRGMREGWRPHFGEMKSFCGRRRRARYRCLRSRSPFARNKGQLALTLLSCLLWVFFRYDRFASLSRMYSLKKKI